MTLHKAIELLTALGLPLTAEHIGALLTTAGDASPVVARVAEPVAQPSHETAYRRTLQRLADAPVRVPATRKRAPRLAASLTHYRTNGRPVSDAQLAALFPTIGLEGNVPRVYHMVARAGNKGVTVPEMVAKLSISDKAAQSAVWYLRNYDRSGQRVAPESRTAMLAGGAR